MAIRAISALVGLALAAPGVAFADPPALARLYVFHAANDVLRYNTPLTIDGKFLKGGVMPGACVFVDLPPGGYMLHSMSEDSLHLDVSGGQDVFVELRGVSKDLGSSGVIDQATPVLFTSPADISHCLPVEKP